MPGVEPSESLHATPATLDTSRKKDLNRYSFITESQNTTDETEGQLWYFTASAPVTETTQW